MAPSASERARRAAEATAATAQERLERLEQGRRTGILVATARRFSEVDGADFSGLLAVELFTTIVPLIVIGFAYFTGFSEEASMGDLLIRQWNLDGRLADTVRSTFDQANELRSVWSVVGMSSFLIWGIPMSLTVSRMYHRVWRREPYPTGARLWRGGLWFVLFLVALIGSERIVGLGRGHGPVLVALFWLLGLLPSWAFWAASPPILVRDGGRGARYLAGVGLAGVVIDVIALRIAGRIALPILLSGWTGFGPIGVALTFMTWSGVVGTSWVLTACLGAVIWERRAPTATVLDAQQPHQQ